MRYEAMVHPATTGGRWDVCAVTSVATVIVATCRRDGSEGMAHLIAKLLNDHEAGDVVLALVDVETLRELAQEGLDSLKHADRHEPNQIDVNMLHEGDRILAQLDPTNARGNRERKD